MAAGDDFLTGYLRDMVRSGVKRDPYDDTYGTSWQGSLISALVPGIDANTEAELVENTAGRRSAQRTLDGLGVSAEMIGLDPSKMTKGGAIAAYHRFNQQQKDRDRNFVSPLDRHTMGIQTQTMQQQLQTLQNQNQIANRKLTAELGLANRQLASAENMQTQKLEYDKSVKGQELALLDRQGQEKRADSALDRAHQLELLAMKQKGDMAAYQENMKHYNAEKSRNQTMGLISSLATLGAALAM